VRQLLTILIAMLGAIALGAGVRRLTWPAIAESAVAIVAGWTLGSIASAAAWFMWPPEGTDVLAVSVGAMEAVLAGIILLGVGFVFHYALEALGTMYPRALAERPLVLCALASIWGVLAFGASAAVRPVV
jgi:hypothetical protein